MIGPHWLAGLLAAVMIMIAAYCAVRLAAWRWGHRITEVDADSIHLLMGVAMAGMLVPRLSPLPSPGWEVVFAVAAAWFAWQAARSGRAAPERGWRCRHPLPHLVECAAMIYMLWAAPGRQARSGELPMLGMTGSAGASTTIPALAMLLTLFMLGYVLWTTDRLALLTRAPSDPADRHEYPASTRMLAPRLAECYKIVMSLAMSYMLIMMI